MTHRCLLHHVMSCRILIGWFAVVGCSDTGWIWPLKHVSLAIVNFNLRQPKIAQCKGTFNLTVHKQSVIKS